MSDEYDAAWKQMAWETYWAGYKLGYGVEMMKPFDRRVAQKRFERMWDETYE
jgi:hypothetical protein